MTHESQTSILIHVMMILYASYLEYYSLQSIHSQMPFAERILLSRDRLHLQSAVTILSSWAMTMTAMFARICLACHGLLLVTSFQTSLTCGVKRHPGLFSGKNSNDERSNSDSERLHKSLHQRSNKIEVEKTRQALEEDNIKSFIKRKPRKLPYEDARNWVQANLGGE